MMRQPVHVHIAQCTVVYRLGGLAYVVAFANQGAKDVTQRYVGSVLAADKLRDNAWWEQTLRPLRKHEVGKASVTVYSSLKLLQRCIPCAHALSCLVKVFTIVHAHP